jgi:hypothetical protein
MAQAHDLSPTLPSLGIRVASAGVDPLHGGVIAWLVVEPAAVGLLDASESPSVRLEEIGRVPQARVYNDGVRPVLFRADSVVTGGRQTRVVERTSIVPPGASALIPVRCVEHGRWAPESAATAHSFVVAGMASRRMRLRLARQRDSSMRATGRPGLDQHAVWNEVADELRASRVPTASQSYAPMVTEVRARDRARARQMRITPAPRANAALVMPDHGSAWVEVFPSSGALVGHAEELAADLVEASRSRDGEPSGPTSVGQALEQLLAASVLRAEPEAGSPGEPFALQSPRVCGSLLMLASRVAHLSAVIG